MGVYCECDDDPAASYRLQLRGVGAVARARTLHDERDALRTGDTK